MGYVWINVSVYQPINHYSSDINHILTIIKNIGNQLSSTVSQNVSHLATPWHPRPEALVRFQHPATTAAEPAGSMAVAPVPGPVPWRYPNVAGFFYGKSQAKILMIWVYPHDLGHSHLIWRSYCKIIPVPLPKTHWNLDFPPIRGPWVIHGDHGIKLCNLCRWHGTFGLNQEFSAQWGAQHISMSTRRYV